MKPSRYVSFEQEKVLVDLGKVVAISPCPLVHGYVVVSSVPWGHESEAWEPELIGPIPDAYSAGVVAGVVSLLAGAGFNPLTTDMALGEFVMGGFYVPSANE